MGADVIGQCVGINPIELKPQCLLHLLAKLEHRSVMAKPVGEQHAGVAGLTVDAPSVDALSDQAHRLLGPLVQLPALVEPRLAGQGLVGQ